MRSDTFAAAFHASEQPRQPRDLVPKRNEERVAGRDVMSRPARRCTGPADLAAAVRGPTSGENEGAADERIVAAAVASRWLHGTTNAIVV
jgi:hypothetical protein